MSPEISNKEAIEMMNRCKQEIIHMRATIDHLKPKADAYDNLVTVLRLTLDKRIRELQPKPEAAQPA